MTQGVGVAHFSARDTIACAMSPKRRVDRSVVPSPWAAYAGPTQTRTSSAVSARQLRSPEVTRASNRARIWPGVVSQRVKQSPTPQRMCLGNYAELLRVHADVGWFVTATWMMRPCSCGTMTSTNSRRHVAVSGRTAGKRSFFTLSSATSCAPSRAARLRLRGRAGRGDHTD